MITITKKEQVVLDQIKIFNIEYPDGVPTSVLRKELGFHEYDLVEILEELQDKDLVVFKDNKASLSEHEKEINTVNSKQDLEELEETPMVIIRNVTTGGEQSVQKKEYLMTFLNSHEYVNIYNNGTYGVYVTQKESLKK